MFKLSSTSLAVFIISMLMFNLSKLNRGCLVFNFALSLVPDAQEFDVSFTVSGGMPTQATESNRCCV